MTIEITPMTTCIDQMMHDSQVTKPQQAALDFFAKFAHHAQNSAYTYPPMNQFTYTESISAALVEALTCAQKEKLTDLGITLVKHTGLPYYTVKSTFHS